MPLWKVKRGRDAYAIEETIVEAESAEQAEQIATDRDNRDVVKWADTGEVVTFDDTRLFDGETVKVEDDEDALLLEARTLLLSPREAATLFASMQHYADEGFDERHNRPDRVNFFATSNGMFRALERDEVYMLLGKLSRFFSLKLRMETPVDPAAANFHTITVSREEHSTILAALRMWIDNLMRGPDYFSDALLEIATNGDKHDLLAPEAIDALCERVNV